MRILPLYCLSTQAIFLTREFKGLCQRKLLDPQICQIFKSALGVRINKQTKGILVPKELRMTQNQYKQIYLVSSLQIHEMDKDMLSSQTITRCLIYEKSRPLDVSSLSKLVELQLAKKIKAIKSKCGCNTSNLKLKILLKNILI